MRTLLACLLALICAAPLRAETAAEILSANAALVKKASRQTIAPVIDALGASGDPTASAVLEAWANKGLGIRKADGLFFLITANEAGYALTDLTGALAGEAANSDITELKPIAGVRGMIATALVQFTLSDPDPLRRAAALDSIAKDPKIEALTPLRAAIPNEPDPSLKSQKQRLERLLTLRFDPDSTARIAAINSFGAELGLDLDLGLDLRGALTPLLATTKLAAAEPPTTNIARELKPGRDLTETEAYDLLVADNLAPARLTIEAARAALIANLVNGSVGGVPLSDLNTQAARDRAYTAVEAAGTVPQAATDDESAAALAAHRFYDIYTEPEPAVTTAAGAALKSIGHKVAAMQAADLALDGLSLASIYFLAAIGLAITSASWV